MSATQNRTEIILRVTRRSMMVVLLIILTLGIVSLASALHPDGTLAHLTERAPWMIPIAIVIAVGALQTQQRRAGVTVDSPERQMVLKDEWRQANLDRARSITLLVTLIAQIPIALLLAQSPGGLGVARDLTAFRAVMAMAVATITLSATVFFASVLILDRE